jgi:hypothetical protein
MNERIKELERQAIIGVLKGNDPDRDVDRMYISAEFTKKFAELIVNECMNQVREQYLPVLEDEHMMKDTHWDGYVQCGVDSYVAIREHFYGVEE